MGLTIEKPDLCEHGSVPIMDRWRNDLLRYWRGAHTIVIQKMSNPEKRTGFTKIQKIKLQPSTKTEMPKTDPDDVLEAIATTLFGWLSIQEEEGKILNKEEVHFAVEVQRTLGKSDAPTRNKFYLSASLSEGETEDIYANPEMEALTEIERRQQMFNENLLRENDALRIHTENLHETLIKLATINVAPVKEASRVLEMAGNMQLSGSQSLLNALAMQYDEKKAEAEQREKTRRHEMWMNGVGQHFLPYLPGVGAWVMSKVMGGGHGNPPEPQMSRPPQPQEGPPQEQWPAALDYLRKSITADQHNTLVDALTRDEQKALWSLLGAPTDFDAFRLYQELIEVAEDLATIVTTLQACFTQEQTQIVMSLHMAVAKWMEHQEKEHTEP